MEFFTDPTQLGLWMVLAALACVGFLFANFRRFRHERTLLARLKEHLPQDTAKVDEFWANLKSGSIIPTNSITFQRADAVRYLEHSWIPVDATTLSEIAAASDDSRRINAIPNFLVSIFLIVGLGGTFLALKDLLHNSPLRDVTTSGQIDPRRLQVAIDQIYQGFGAAFYASITGIAATVVLLAIRLVCVAPERDKFYSELDQVTQLYLIPLSRLRHDESSLYAYAAKISENLAEATEQAGKVVTELTVHTKSTGASMDQIKSFVSELRTAMDEVSDLFGSESDLQNAIYELVAFTTKADRRHEDLSAKISDALTNSAADNEVLNRICDSSRENIEKLLEAHAYWVKTADRAEDRFVAALSKHNAELEKILSRNTESMTYALNSLSETIRSIPPSISCADLDAAVDAILPLSQQHHEPIRRDVTAADATARVADHIKGPPFSIRDREAEGTTSGVPRFTPRSDDRKRSIPTSQQPLRPAVEPIPTSPKLTWWERAKKRVGLRS